jgi:trehalose/maltose hydrolase-like predicted phosphorylase
MLQPEIAKSILEYRFQRLELAKKNAFSHGYKGAMFPWESDEEGMEATPVWALTGPFQHHITGCIGFAFWQYYQVTQDKTWLADRGYPLLKEVADFWCSRVERNGTGHFDIKNVIGADEYAENIDNNAFTNGVAIASLQAATKAAQALNITPNPDWATVAANIPLPKMKGGATAEYDGYEGITIKQADVNLLAYPLNVITDATQVKKDLDYYEPRYDSKNGPAMGPSVLSILHNRQGNADKATEWFKKSYKPNEVPPFGVISETAGGTNPYFATGAGGALQAVINGFGALEITQNGIVQLSTKTKLPAGWQTLKITGVGVDKKTFEIK